MNRSHLCEAYGLSGAVVYWLVDGCKNNVERAMNVLCDCTAFDKWLGKQPESEVVRYASELRDHVKKQGWSLQASLGGSVKVAPTPVVPIDRRTPAVAHLDYHLGRAIHFHAFIVDVVCEYLYPLIPRSKVLYVVVSYLTSSIVVRSAVDLMDLLPKLDHRIALGESLMTAFAKKHIVPFQGAYAWDHVAWSVSERPKFEPASPTTVGGRLQQIVEWEGLDVSAGSYQLVQALTEENLDLVRVLIETSPDRTSLLNGHSSSSGVPCPFVSMLSPLVAASNRQGHKLELFFVNDDPPCWWFEGVQELLRHPEIRIPDSCLHMRLLVMAPDMPKWMLSRWLTVFKQNYQDAAKAWKHPRWCQEGIFKLKREFGLGFTGWLWTRDPKKVPGYAEAVWAREEERRLENRMRRLTGSSGWTVETNGQTDGVRHLDWQIEAMWPGQWRNRQERVVEGLKGARLAVDLAKAVATYCEPCTHPSEWMLGETCPNWAEPSNRRFGEGALHFFLRCETNEKRKIQMREFLEQNKSFLDLAAGSSLALKAIRARNLPQLTFALDSESACNGWVDGFGIPLDADSPLTLAIAERWTAGVQMLVNHGQVRVSSFHLNLTKNTAELHTLVRNRLERDQLNRPDCLPRTDA